MASPLHTLKDLLGPDVSQEKLVDALYTVRAPRHLVGIIPAMRQFRDWRGIYPALCEFPALPGYQESLRILDRIADLDTSDEHLSGRTTKRFESVWTPLRPLTGDSVICELLLIRAGEGVDPGIFERASAWLLWQAQRFHQHGTSRAWYERYLVSSSERLLGRRLASRLYGAYLALRHLAIAEPVVSAQLKSLVNLAGEFNDEQSQTLTLLVRLARLSGVSPELARLRRHALEVTGMSPGQLEEAVSHVERTVPRELARLLVTVWGRTLLRNAGLRVAPARGVDIRSINRPQIRRGERLTEILLAADEGEVHAATVVEIYPGENASVGGPRQPDADDDDPVESPEQPGFSLVLAEGAALLKGYYAAKGIQNAIEYDNAQLYWDKWTLSQAAIGAVVEMVRSAGHSDSSPLDHEARLAIGLSLLTGRSLEEVAQPVIHDEMVTLEEGVTVAISRTGHYLLVRAGHPELRTRPKASQPLCHPRSEFLVLPLPGAWRPVVQVILDPRPRSRKAIVTQARQLLGSLAPALRVTPKGVRAALLRGLNAQTHGDLGVIGVVTAGAEANARNIIHYASYERGQIETWWRRAAEALVGELPEGPVPESVGLWVGAQHAFDGEALAAYFAGIKQRVRAAEAGHDWPRAFNLMTLYLAYWLGLGLAQRRTLSPVPRIVLKGDWALVADKHRIDGSTDRLVPMTRTLRAQIDAYVALASELSITTPALDPLVVTDEGVELRLQYIRVGTSPGQQDVVPYQPKYQERDEQLTPLPANWGRKFVRSVSGHLPGRFRDAELGHWVRGRHAWDATSTFDPQRFQVAWLALQETLERQLGFDTIHVAGCMQSHRSIGATPALPSIGRTTASIPEGGPAGPTSSADAEELLRSVNDELFDTIEGKPPADRPALALELARQVVRTRDRDAMDRQREVAESVCQFMRKQWKVPIFAVRPRPLFSNKVMLDSQALQTLGYVEACVLPAFERELACLPARLPSSDRGLGNTDHQVEFGRLVMLAIWRLGLTRWGLIDAWLGSLKIGTPILAQGDNRYMVFRARNEGTRETMQRTVFLDDFTSTYLTVERSFLQTSLLDPLFAHATASRRRAKTEVCLRAYLGKLGAGEHRVSMAMMTAAATQYVMIHGAPIIASYATGKLITEDLGDGELRRLGGLVPMRQTGAGVEEGLPATRTSGLGESSLPKDLIDRLPVLKALGSHRTPYKSEWLRLVRVYKPASPVEQLLCSFCLWLIESSTEPGEREVNAHQKRHVINRVMVIAYAFLGFATASPEGLEIDETALSQLQEISRDQFPDRLQHGAWFHFHRYLSDRSANHAGFTIGSIGPAPERAVSAKILSADELHHLHSRLLSAKSGIGNAALRTSAQRHEELMETFGLRRAESAHLRAIDLQEDLCRVQAYGTHTLKTAWADRVLPMGFAHEDTRAWVQAGKVDGVQKLIDADAHASADPNNFYDALSRLIKAVTQDQSMGSHHLRHTLVSRLVLTLLWRPAGLDALGEALPWLAGLRISDERMAALLGPEGDAGQGMRAVAALVGHSHPTTTIRHYTHVLCVALRGVLKKLDRLDMRRSFENRLGGKATVYRWMAQIREQYPDTVDITQHEQRNRAIRQRIEQRCRDAGIDRDETPLPAVRDFVPDAGGSRVEEGIHFDRIELVDRSLRDDHLLVPEDEVAVYRAGLAWLASLRTGKEGSTVPRHVLKVLNGHTFVPPALAAGSATTAAAVLCTWLEALRVDRKEDFFWLLEKWMHASERERGRMRLVDGAEVERARHLADATHVQVVVEPARVAARDQDGDAKPVPRMRIKCLDARGKAITRDTLAVRWVMTYVAARWGSDERKSAVV
jgi:site-specific recombinase XerD